jgi:histidinol-phosphate/aromatic aminotransferase/cobyric acid decarboxylase-like protein
VFDFLKARGIIVRKFGDNVRITAGTAAENAALLAALAQYASQQTAAKQHQ